MPAAAMAARSRWRRAVARGMLSAIIPIITPRRLHRHIPLRNIIRDLAAVAPARVAPAGAAGVLAQREALDQERILHFLQLDRRIAHIALADRHRGGFAVLPRPPAPAAAEDVHQQKTPAVGAEA